MDDARSLKRHGYLYVITRFISLDENEQTLSLNLSGKFRALLKFLTQKRCRKVGKDVNESKFQIH